MDVCVQFTPKLKSIALCVKQTSWESTPCLGKIIMAFGAFILVERVNTVTYFASLLQRKTLSWRAISSWNCGYWLRWVWYKWEVLWFIQQCFHPVIELIRVQNILFYRLLSSSVFHNSTFLHHLAKYCHIFLRQIRSRCNLWCYCIRPSIILSKTLEAVLCAFILEHTITVHAD
jgi:hypothetical protein